MYTSYRYRKTYTTYRNTKSKTTDRYTKAYRNTNTPHLYVHTLANVGCHLFSHASTENV